jgi:hypothetical protein
MIEIKHEPYPQRQPASKAPVRFHRVQSVQRTFRTGLIHRLNQPGTTPRAELFAQQGPKQEALRLQRGLTLQLPPPSSGLNRWSAHFTSTSGCS